MFTKTVIKSIVHRHMKACIKDIDTQLVISDILQISHKYSKNDIIIDQSSFAEVKGFRELPDAIYTIATNDDFIGYLITEDAPMPLVTMMQIYCKMNHDIIVEVAKTLVDLQEPDLLKKLSEIHNDIDVFAAQSKDESDEYAKFMVSSCIGAILGRLFVTKPAKDEEIA